MRTVRVLPMCTMVTYDPTPARRRRRRSTRAATLALACAMTLTLAPGSVLAASARQDPDAQRKAQVDKRIDALKDDLDDTSASLRSAYTALEKTKAQLPGAQAALQSAQAAAVTADQRNAEAVTALAVATANERKAESDLARTHDQIQGARQRVAAFAAQLYQQQGLGQLSVAMDASSPTDFADRMSMMGTVMDVQQRSITALATSEADQTAQEDHLSALRADRAEAQQAAQVALAAAQAARDAAAREKSTLDALAAQQTTQAAALASQKSAEQQKLAGMKAESDRLRRLLADRARKAREAAARAAAAARKRGQAAPSPPDSGKFLSAAELSQPITSEYGMRFHPILHIWRLHTGLDFGGPCGTPIYAAAPGTIVSAGWAGGYGNRVVIDHGMVGGVDLATAYNHMQRIVAHGGTVKRGQLLGYEGTTGMSTGCHLHFETLENGSFVNPRKYL